RILRHQNQLLHAFFSKLMSFGDDRSKATAAKMAAHLRNEAESTGTITAFRDFYERIMRRCCQHARCRFVVKIGRTLIPQGKNWKRTHVRIWIADRKNVIYLAGTDESINFRH